MCGQQVEGGNPHLVLRPGEAMYGVQCAVLCSLVKEGQEILERVHCRDTKTVRGLEHFPHEESLRDHELFNLDQKLRNLSILTNI